MKTIAGSALVLGATVWMAASAVAQTPVGALAIDERPGDQYGWGSVVLTFERCAAYAADQDADSTAVGWAESYSSSSAAQQAALGQCSSRGGGSGCIVRVWGCNGPVVEGGLGLDRATRRAIQEDLQAAGFDPGGADGMFGPRTRSAIRRWQTSRGARATGYLDGASVASLRPSVVGQPRFREREPAGAAAASPATTASSTAAASAAQQQSPPASAELEGLFWQSIVNSTDPADFEAYLEEFPNGVFRRLAENRLAALRSSRRRVGDVFRDCPECPEMVVLAGGVLAMGRYEVTVGEYRAFASATGTGAGGCRVRRLFFGGGSWRDPGFPQTNRHPVTCVSWDDAQEYVSWLSRRTGATYRLPTEEEWGRAASGSQPGCDVLGIGTYPDGTCPVGQHGTNAAGLSDMVGNVWEWTSDCWSGDCGRRVVRGGSWVSNAEVLRPGARFRNSTAGRGDVIGFRVSRTLD